jgi:hypothetical protein
MYCILKKKSFVLHTQKSTQTDFCTAYSKKRNICTAHSKKHSKSRQKRQQKKTAKKDSKKVVKKYAKKSTLPYTQHTWLIIRKKHFLKHILEPDLLLS